MKNLIIESKITIRQALKKLNQGGEKCLVVTDNNNILLGTLSDGDLRKAILNGSDMSNSIHNIYNAKPTVFIEGEYEIDEATKKTVLDYLIDVHKIARNSVAFPTYGNGLKQIAPYLGFSWRHKDVSATESISMYLDYVDNSEEGKVKFQKIIDYNEDDCIATRVIKDWLINLI